MSGSVRIDGLEFNGPSRHGSCSVSLEGWWGRPDPKGQSVSAPNADGDLDLPIWNGPRYVTLTGLFQAKSHVDMHAWMDRVNGLLQGIGSKAGDQQAGGRLLVAGHGGDRWAPVKWDAAADMQDRTDTLVSYQLKLKSPRPQKFGDVNEFLVPASAAYSSVIHRGNTAAYPVLVITGSAPNGYSVQTNDDIYYSVTRPLISGTPHIIDMRNGRLMVGNQFVAGQVTTAGIWRVWPGNPLRVRLNPISGGSASMTVSTFDTYI